MEGIDWRWAIGTAIALAGLIVAAVTGILPLRKKPPILMKGEASRHDPSPDWIVASITVQNRDEDRWHSTVARLTLPVGGKICTEQDIEVERVAETWELAEPNIVTPDPASLSNSCNPRINVARHGTRRNTLIVGDNDHQTITLWIYSPRSSRETRISILFSLESADRMDREVHIPVTMTATDSSTIGKSGIQ